MDDPATEPAVIRRRRFILHELHTKGVFTLEDLQAHAAKPVEEDGQFPVSPQSVRDDVKFLQQLLRLEISRVRGQDGKTIYLNGGDPRSTIDAKIARASLNKEAKLAMAYVAGTLILGSTTRIENVFTCGDSKRFPWKANFEDPVAILRQLSRFPTLQNRVCNYWSQITRRACLDTGSSMDAIARYALRGVKLPSPDTVLSYLEICTNSRGIFSYLGRPEVRSRVIIIGGSQEVNTEAVCGFLAESFLDKLELNFGITFVGATVVDLKNKQFGCDNPRIATIKAKMLERAAIRVVVADSSKFTSEPTRQYYPFATLSSTAVDIVISDSDLINFAPSNGVDLTQASASRKTSILEESGIAFIFPHSATVAAAREKIANEVKRDKKLRAAGSADDYYKDDDEIAEDFQDNGPDSV